MTGIEGNVADSIARWAAENPEVRRVWVFGSRANDTHRANRDIDIAVELEPVGDSEEMVARWISCADLWRSQLQSRVDPKVDLEWFDPDGSSPSDLDAAFAAVLRERAQAIYIYPLRIHRTDVARIMDFATKHRLPTMAAVSQAFLSAGVLFFHSHSLDEQYYRLGIYVDRVLKGAKPAELPVERPTKFELIINLKTAQAIGLAVPESLLVRADRVIR